MLTLKQLSSHFAQQGQVRWIGLRAVKGAPLSTPPAITLKAGLGIIGDRYSERNRGGPRQVTLIQAEHLPVIAQMMGVGNIDPELMRRNVLIAGINLLSLIDRRFQLGTAILIATGRCQPCSKMEIALGHGGFNAMRGHGGITARVIEDGEVKLLDPLIPLTDPHPE